jgi:hypothetical protein
MLITEIWPAGSMIVQASHAVSKLVWNFRANQSIMNYMNDIDNMTKVCLMIKNENQLRILLQQFKEQEIEFVEWVEQPENVLTCN